MQSQTASKSASIGRFGLWGMCALAASLLVALLGPSIARAADSFVPAGEIGSGELQGPARIAVDQASGDVLVVDGAQNRVAVYGSSGAGAPLLTTFGEADLSGPYGIAVDPTDGDVYVTDPGHERILRYTTDGASPPAYTLDAGYSGPAAGTGSEQVGSFSSAIAVDPTDGDLLVADRGNDRVERFSSAGAFVSSFDGSDSPGGAFTNLEDLTLSPAGEIFVADGEAAAGAPSRVLRFANDGTYEATLREPAVTGDAYLAYDAAHTELMVGDARECFFCSVSIHVLDPTDGSLLLDLPVPSEQLTGIASSVGSGRLYAASLRGEFFAPPKVQVFASQTHPDLTLNAPGPIAPFTAHLSGTINPHGVATAYHFEISKDGGTTWQRSPDPDADAGEGNSPVAVATDIAVEPNTHYVAKLVASNTDGAEDSTPVQPFDTQPVAPETKTREATEVTETSAALNGTINPFGLPATYYFEYGPTAAYGTKIPAGIEAVAGSGREVRTVTRKIVGLAPGTEYHFRLVATNVVGPVTTADRTFTTATAGSAAIRGYEQVSLPEKSGGAIIPGLGYQAAKDGNALAYFTKTSSQATPLEAYSVALRGTSDWIGRIDTDLPVNSPKGGGIFQQFTLTISDDFRHALVVTNRALTPGAVERGANLYLTDIGTGSKRLIASAPGEEAYVQFVTSTYAGKYQGGAPDFSWLVFLSPPPLLPGAAPNALYRWSEAGGLEVVSVLPDGDTSSAYSASNAPHYEAVSADGSRIYYSAYGGSEQGVFLRESGGPPIPISVSHVSGEPTNPQRATLLGITPNGRFAFFVCETPLTSDGSTGNLYRYDRSDGSLEFLGAQAEVFAQAERISVGSFGIGDDGNSIYFNGSSTRGEGSKFLVWHDGELHTIGPEPLVAGAERVSPNGRYFAFYPSARGQSGPIQLYDAATNQITCVSCLPDGSPVEGRMPNQGEVYVSNYHPRVVDDDGTVYFGTPARLVPRDVNGASDVYSYRDGKYTLISPGDADFDAILADVSEGGSDIFFTTAQKLVPRDNDQSVDIYDARINGGLSGQGEPEVDECSRQCKAPPGATVEPPHAGSEALAGPGNVRPVKAKKVKCGKGRSRVRVHGKTKCVRKHRHRKHGKHQHRKAGAKHKPGKTEKGGDR